MPLIASPRHEPADLEAWSRLERLDSAHAKTRQFNVRVAKAMTDLATFARAGRCYVSSSWGKDSVVVAHLSISLGVPIVWVNRTPIDNPDCAAVAAAFGARYRAAMLTAIHVPCERDPKHPENWWAVGVPGRRDPDRPKQVGFARAVEQYGARYVSGVRGEESGVRKTRMMRHGVATTNVCAPIGWWSSQDVFAYLYANKLPVHPAYACTMGGALDRGRLRVGSLGGPHGRGHGRLAWEWRYYRREMIALGERAP